MKITLLGFTVTDEMIAEINRRDANLASQTHRFAWSVVAALNSAGDDVDLLSSMPVSDYPRNPRLLWRGQSFDQRGVVGFAMPFVNALVVKHLSRSLSAWIWGLRILKRRRPDWILVHGVHTPFLWFAVSVAPRVGSRVCVLLTDAPGVVLPGESRLRSTLKRLDTRVTQAALARADSLVVLAKPLADDFAPGVQHIVMEGLYNPDSWQTPPARRPSSRVEIVVTYAGGLSEAYGVANLVKAVMASDQPQLRLRLYGRGSLERWIAQMAKRDERISSAELIDPSGLAFVYSTSDVLVQPRPQGRSFVPYSFPSKLIEYMASGTPVISTRLPSIPEDYGPYVVWCDDDVEGLKNALETVSRWTPRQRRIFGASASDFVIQSRSVVHQGKRIHRFLSDISGHA